MILSYCLHTYSFKYIETRKASFCPHMYSHIHANLEARKSSYCQYIEIHTYIEARPINLILPSNVVTHPYTFIGLGIFMVWLHVVTYPYIILFRSLVIFIM